MGAVTKEELNSEAVDSATPSPPSSPARQNSPASAGDSLYEDHPEWMQLYEGKSFRVSSLLPPVRWLPAYIRCHLKCATEEDKEDMGLLVYSWHGDFIAGLTVGCMLVPQSLAFAVLAGLPLQTGLYASFAPLLAYSLFGTIRQVQPGPTALMSLLTGQALDQLELFDDGSRIAGASLLALVVGAASIALGCMRFGFLVDFMSHSVMNAFCAAAGVTICTSQLKHLLGISMDRKKYWWQTAWYLASHLSEVKIPTLVLGWALLAFLLSLKAWKTAGGAEKRQQHPLWRWLPVDKNSKSFRALKLIADLSSVISVVIGWLWAFAYRSAGIDSVELVGDVHIDGFTFVVPGDGLESFQIDTLLVSALVMTVVGFLETVAVGGKFAAQARYEYSPNQELLALGISNIAGAVMAGYPTTGSFSRTAVNAMFGASSLLACLCSAVVVLLAVYLILPVIALLPFSALAPIIIQGAIGVINVQEFRVAWRASKSEFLVMMATFSMSLALSVKEGLLVGFGLSVLKTMYDLANPNLAVVGQMSDHSFRDIRNYPNARQFKEAVVLRMDARLSFTNARKLKNFALRAVRVRERTGSKIRYVVIDTKAINHVDLSGCEALEVLAETLHSHGQQLILANLKGPVSKCLHEAGVPAFLKKKGGHLCTSIDSAVAMIEGMTEEAGDENLDIQELVRRVSEAKRVLSAQSPNHIFCGHQPVFSPWKGSAAALDEVQRTLDEESEPSSAQTSRTEKLHDATELADISIKVPLEPRT
eukprot:CAMPEP_0197632938 /NCGR_PEP_ID=MMETSP1338-20131121/9444_1 /TAXON_ID=43686 ORGANISM="Pelagodinium beii, Strain RCC1491" /NCGR_SAMPLE_ID=MMETSP1338 /ASSEMBLY_ACC=CAM_ASM_000754 /LENGTH=760 /DNA_ID=CAMNT_0043204515 /DNA_START=97 /DNA_END=2379 /DNA_ORIENTATION=-